MHWWKAVILSGIPTVLFFVPGTNAGPISSTVAHECWETRLISHCPNPSSEKPSILTPRAITDPAPQFALPDSWVASVHQFSAITQVSPNAIQSFESFWKSIMAAVLAQMLQNAPLRRRVRFSSGPWSLTLRMTATSSVPALQWEFVYYFARYFLRWAERGTLGYGGVTFRHPSGVVFEAVFRKLGGLTVAGDRGPPW